MKDSAANPDPLPRGKSGAAVHSRDFVLLPLLSLITIGVLYGFGIFMAMGTLPQSKTHVWSCMVGGDDYGQLTATAARGVAIRARANSACWEKQPESPLVEYRFNACGYRSAATCGPPLVGTLRVVLIGSSFTMGYQVPDEQTLAFRLGKELSALTGRKVEIDNQAMLWGFPHSVDERFEEALNARPDIIIWPITPSDIENVSPNTRPELTPADAVTTRKKNLWERLSNDYDKLIYVSRWYSIKLLLQHWLYLSQSQYTRNLLKGSDVEIGFLKKEPSPMWKERWREFDAYASDVAVRSKASGVPLILATVPDRQEASLISAHDWPSDVDPFEFGQELRSVTASIGATYLNLLPAFRNVPAAERLYYPYDGHLNGNGHALVARLLADRLTDGRFPALKKVR